MRTLTQIIRSASTETIIRPEGPTTAEFLIHSDNPSLEGYIDQITERLPQATVERMPSFQAALESQQLDENQHQRDVEEQYQDLVDLLNPQAKSGSVQVFLLDEAGGASGHAGSQAALKAVVRASMKDNSRVVAALTSTWRPSESEQTVVVSAHAIKAHRALIKNYLNGANIPAFESVDELVAYLNKL